MVNITLSDGQSFPCDHGDTILRAALRQGLGLDYECSVGVCGVCKVSALSGEFEDLRPDAPGLSERDRRKGRILACQARPKVDCVIRVEDRPDQRPPLRPQALSGRLSEIEDLSHDMRRLVVETAEPAHFLAGQYALLTPPNGPERAYSLANIANASGKSGKPGRWEFIIRRVTDGAAGRIWFDPELKPGASVSIDAPYGHAYLRDSERDVVCVAGGSGLAPMLSIVRAIAAEHTHRRVFLFQGVRTAADRCGEELVRALAGYGERIQHHIVISQGNAPAGCTQGLVHEAIRDRLGDQLEAFDFYAAGPPPMLDALESLLDGRAPDRLRFDRFF